MYNSTNTTEIQVRTDQKSVKSSIQWQTVYQKYYSSLTAADALQGASSIGDKLGIPSCKSQRQLRCLLHGVGTSGMLTITQLATLGSLWSLIAASICLFPVTKLQESFQKLFKSGYPHRCPTLSHSHFCNFIRMQNPLRCDWII